MKLFYLTLASSALASICKSKFPTLLKACGDDYSDYCADNVADNTNLVQILGCAKRNEAKLNSECLAEIKKDFLANYMCSEDLSTRCPSFGKMNLRPEEWASEPNPTHKQMPPAQPQPAQPHEPAPLPNSNDEDMPKPQNSTEPEPDTWLYWNFDDFFPSQPSTGLDSFHSKEKGSSASAKTCFLNAYPTFSRSCHDAIFQQWTAGQTKSTNGATGPTAEQAYDMMTPPSLSRSERMKMTRALYFIALAFFVCVLGMCVCCCCCRRCKKRRQQAARIVPEGQEVALTPLPEATVVSMGEPERYVPMAAPVTAGRPAYRPYTGDGLIPVAMPARV